MTARRILVVEDNFDAAESLRLVLELSGHDVAVAHTGEDGLKQAEAFGPDVVLCDIGLPTEMSGYGFAKALRASGAQTHLIALTGNMQASEAYDAGFNQHLMKPVDPSHLRSILEQL
jgi:two-component system CheB/CheR fusion protein